MILAILSIVYDIGLTLHSINSALVNHGLPKTIHEEVHEIRKILEDKFVVEVSTS